MRIVFTFTARTDDDETQAARFGPDSVERLERAPDRGLEAVLDAAPDP